MPQVTLETLRLWRHARVHRQEVLLRDVPEGHLVVVDALPNPWAPATEASRCQVVIPRAGRLGRAEFHRCKRRTKLGPRCWQHLVRLQRQQGRDPERCEACEARTFQLRAANRLADAVAAMVVAGRLDPRSQAADRLLDYRDPPQTDWSRRRGEEMRQAALENRSVLGVLYAYEADTIRREHVRVVLKDVAAPDRVECHACSWLWPCPTLRLLNVLRLDTAFPLREVLQRLVAAVEHLLSGHNCDCEGHEGIRYVQQAAQRALDEMNTGGADATP